MNFDLSPEHELVRRTVREFAEQKVAPVAANALPSADAKTVTLSTTAQETDSETTSAPQATDETAAGQL